MIAGKEKLGTLNETKASYFEKLNANEKAIRQIKEVTILIKKDDENK